MVKIGINGFNRLGKIILRQSASLEGVQVTVINDPLIDTDYLAYLTRYDSIYGRFNGRIEGGSGKLLVGNNEIDVRGNVSPSEVSWEDTDIVIETNPKATKDQAELIFKGKAKKVVVASGLGDIPVFAMGINNKEYKGETLFSAGTCEANAVAVLTKVINDCFGVENAVAVNLVSMSYESMAIDGKNNGRWRNGRMASESVIPMASGIGPLAEKLLPEIKGLVSGITVSVPVKAGDMISLVCKLKTDTDYTTVVDILRKASENKFKGFLGVTDESVVSADFISCKHTVTVDTRAGFVQGKNLLKLTGWYDKEWGYVSSLLELLKYTENSLS